MLKDFQIKTVEHLARVFSNQLAYLVADEVGLGKTFVARGLIEKKGYKRIIYVASNAQIAAQNAKDLISKDAVINDVDRLSMLTGSEKWKEMKNKDEKCVLSLSPITSFTGEGASKKGDVKERNLYGLKDNCTENDVKEQRSEYCKKAVISFKPDLIILDEFHRYNQLIDEGKFKEQYFSLQQLIETATKEEEKVKLLLLSATPYKYYRDKGKNIKIYVRDAGKEEEDNTEKLYSKPYEDFDKLAECICKFNNIKYEKDKTDIFEKVMCRTEREWLQGDWRDVSYDDIDWCNAKVVKDHLKYRSDYIKTIRIDEESVQKITDAQQKKIKTAKFGKGSLLIKDKKPKDIVYQEYSDIRRWLDETPEYLQFSKDYRSILGASNGENAEHTFLIKELLNNSNNYRIKLSGEGFEEICKHAKLSSLINHCLEIGAELRLWVPPVLGKTSGKDAFGKTVVFTHYKMTTRSVAVLTSMEMHRRIMKILNNNALYEQYRLDENDTDSLINVVKEWLGDKCDETIDCLKKAVCIFFNTEYVRQVINGYAIQNNISEKAYHEIINDYCEQYEWDKMIREYLECLCKFEKKLYEKDKYTAVNTLISVLNWSDNDSTRVTVLPDWYEDGYKCSIGERYVSDYSDKGAHDKDKSKSGNKYGEKCITTKRLEFIRERFQSPFYPFVLAASETAQEGVNLQNYCNTVFHWSVPSNLNTFVQEEGRIDRMNSLTIRRQLRWWYEKKGFEICDKDLSALFEKAIEVFEKEYGEEKLCQLKGNGLFPNWFLPKPDDSDQEEYPKIRRILFSFPGSRDGKVYAWLLEEQKQYRKFGIEGKQDLREEICPMFVKKE